VEKNWILQLGKWLPRAPAAREAAATTPRGGLPPPQPPPRFGDVFEFMLRLLIDFGFDSFSNFGLQSETR